MYLHGRVKMDLKGKFERKDYLIAESLILAKEIKFVEDRLNRTNIDLNTRNYLESKLIELNLLLQDNLNHSFNLR